VFTLTPVKQHKEMLAICRAGHYVLALFIPKVSIKIMRVTRPSSITSITSQCDAFLCGNRRNLP
jgi:hypothetical protein